MKLNEDSLQDLKDQTDIGIGGGMIVSLLSIAVAIEVMSLNDSRVVGLLLGSAVYSLGSAVLVWSCCMDARRKGHSAAWGLLGVLFLPGLALLSCLRDKRLESQPLSFGFPIEPAGTPSSEVQSASVDPAPGVDAKGPE